MAARSPGDRGAGEGRAGPQLRPVPARGPRRERTLGRAAVKSGREAAGVRTRAPLRSSRSRCLTPLRPPNLPRPFSLA